MLSPRLFHFSATMLCAAVIAFPASVSHGQQTGGGTGTGGTGGAVVGIGGTIDDGFFGDTVGGLGLGAAGQTTTTVGGIGTVTGAGIGGVPPVTVDSTASNVESSGVATGVVGANNAAGTGVVGNTTIIFDDTTLGGTGAAAGNKTGIGNNQATPGPAIVQNGSAVQSNGGVDRPALNLTGVPALIPTLNLPPVRITFDAVLNPIGSGGGNSVLSPDAQRIVDAHLVARQQSHLSVQYLQINRDRILAGEDELYNEVFGAFYGDNPFRGTGTYNETAQVAVLSRFSADYNTLTLQPQFGLGTGDFAPVNTGLATVAATDPFTVTTTNDGSRWLMKFKAGDTIALYDSLTGTTELAIIRDIVHDGDFSNVRILIDQNKSPAGLLPVAGAEIFRVERFEEMPNPEHFNQVLSTFTAIRDFMNLSTEYQGAFRDLATEYPANTSTFDIGLETVLGEDATRRLREAGYSNSDSFAHLVNLMALGDPNNTTALPLLWTDDNDSDGDGIPDEGSPFFNFVMTVFGALDNPNIQFVGPAFLNEELKFAADFFDNSVASSTPLETDAQGNPIPGTGTPITKPTALKQWQMLIRSFAEHSSNLSMDNVAVVGLLNIQEQFFPGGSSLFLKAKAAESYAIFADMIKSMASGGKIDPKLIEPVGKRAKAGFNPTIVLDPNLGRVDRNGAFVNGAPLSQTPSPVEEILFNPQVLFR